MEKSSLSIMNRITILKSRSSKENGKIIKKLERKLRKEISNSEKVN